MGYDVAAETWNVQRPAAIWAPMLSSLSVHVLLAGVRPGQEELEDT